MGTEFNSPVKQLIGLLAQNLSEIVHDFAIVEKDIAQEVVSSRIEVVSHTAYFGCLI